MKNVPHTQACVFEHLVCPHLVCCLVRLLNLFRMCILSRRSILLRGGLRSLRAFSHLLFLLSYFLCIDGNVITQLLAPAVCCHGFLTMLYSIPLEHNQPMFFNFLWSRYLITTLTKNISLCIWENGRKHE